MSERVMTKNTGKMRDWILSLYTPNTGETKVQGLDILDAIEREIAERYVELPLDADGVPIRVGDVLEYDYGEDLRGRETVTALILTNRWDFEFDDENGDSRDVYDMSDFYRSSRHAKPRTVVDVLADFAAEVEQGRNTIETAKKYADELREMMGVDE